MTLTADSTPAEIRAEYFNNADYATTGSVAKAKAFLVACNYLVLIMPTRSAHGGRAGNEIEFDPASIRGQLAKVEAWLAVNDPAAQRSSVIHPDFCSFRD